MEFHYFNPLDKDDKIKADYKKLLLIFHPDTGGDVERCNALTSEYAKLMSDPTISVKPYEGMRVSCCYDYHFLKSLLLIPALPARLRSAVKLRISELDNF